MSDLTIPEFLAVAEAARAEDPEETENFEARLARVRRDRFDRMQFIAVEHQLARSYMTIAEAPAFFASDPATRNGVAGQHRQRNGYGRRAQDRTGFPAADRRAGYPSGR